MNKHENAKYIVFYYWLVFIKIVLEINKNLLYCNKYKNGYEAVGNK